MTGAFQTSSLSRANSDLMDPLADLLRKSDKDLATKVGVLVDMAGTLLATSDRMRRGGELRLTAEEMRKRLIKSTRAHQAALEARQENARTAIADASSTVKRVTAPRRMKAPVAGQV